MRIVPLNQSAGPWLDGCEPPRMISIFLLLVDFNDPSVVHEIADTTRPAYLDVCTAGVLSSFSSTRISAAKRARPET
jgi:hypothetical protein